MDQLSASNFAMDSSALPNSSQGMSSPPPTPSNHDAAAGASEAAALADANARQHPIPPASEPMQYRAIGLVYGTYAPSEEQFTKGFLTTEDGTAIDAVLLGRVMSLVKKHIDLEKPHLWVVYPRTREKQYDLHLQIMGIWEPENLAQDASPPADAATDATEAITEAITEATTETTTATATAPPTEAAEAVAAASQTSTAATTDADAADRDEPDAATPVAEETPAPVEAEAAAPTEAEPEPPTDPAAAPTEPPTAAAEPEPEPEPAIASESAAAAMPEPATIPAVVAPDATAAPTAAPTPATDTKAGGAIAESTDGYFSIRGEVLFYSEEEENLVIRIQQSPKKEGKAPKAFKLILTGKIEGKTIGYFWDLHVQRQGNRLVVQDGTMVAMVPPRKNKKKRGGPHNKSRRPNGARKPWKKGKEGHDAKPAGEVQKPVKRPKRVMKPLGGE